MNTKTTTRYTKSEIFKVYNFYKAVARRMDNAPKAIQRLNKALGILQSNDYYQAEKAAYAPTSHNCSCKDWEFRFAHKRAYTGACKHMLAEIMIENIELDRRINALKD